MPKKAKKTEEFSFGVLFTCIVLDLIDTMLDWGEAGSNAIPYVGTALSEPVFDTLDALLIIVPAFVLLKMDMNKIMMLPVIADPLLDEGLPIPMYTVTYLLSVKYGN